MGLLTKLITGELKKERAINEARTLHAKAYALRYEGGQRSRNRGFAQGTFQSPEDTTNTAERLHMINEARDLEVNDPVAGMILNIFDVYAFGVIRYQPMTGDTALNAEISAFLKEWMKTASYCGRHDFQKIAQLAQRGKKRDGESGIIHITDEHGDYKLQLISGDRIGNPNIVISTSRNDQNGILTDDFGRVEGYDIYTRDKNSSTYRRDEVSPIPACHFSHIFDPFRDDNYHGVTVFKTVITRLRDLKETLEYSRTNIKFRSTQLPYYKTEDGEFPTDGNPMRDNVPLPTHDTHGIELEHVDGTEQQVMRTTEGIMEYPNDFPNQSFGPVMEAQIKEIFAGVGLSYDFNWKVDKLTGTVGRLVTEREDRVMKIEQDNLERQFMRVSISRAIQNGIDTGRISGNSAKKFTGKFFYGARISADYGRDAKADISLVDAGLLTREEYHHIHGRDPEDVRSTILAENLELVEDGAEVAEASGLSQDNAMNLLHKSYPQPPTVQSVSASVQPDKDLAPAPAKPVKLSKKGGTVYPINRPRKQS